MSISYFGKNENDIYPIFFISNYCYNSDDMKQFNKNKILCEEIVSYDCELLDMTEIKYESIGEPTDKYQYLAIIENPTENKNKLLLNDERFKFVGYDLVEDMTAISAITNCGAMFDLAINYENLNSFGLIDSYEEAIKAKELLLKKYPYESHADCIIIEIWRYT